MRKTNHLIGIATILFALLLATTPAFAHSRTTLDQDDTAGPLDTVAAKLKHEEKGVDGLTLRLITYEKWESDILGGGRQFISFEFNLDADSVIERCLVVTKQEVEPGAFALRGDVYKSCKYFDDERVGSTSLVTRPDQHSVKVRVRKRLLVPRASGAYKWRAATSFEEQDQSSSCPTPEPHGDGGYGTCNDLTSWSRHRSS